MDESMSSKPPRSQKISIPGPAGSLEAIVETPTAGELLGIVVVCHPHPQHGGTMHNKVAHTLARSFVRLGYAALRFNFRGTEGSEGEYDDGIGELDDALAALRWMRTEFADGPTWLAGFSFGAAIALRAAITIGEPVDGLVTVAPAVSRFASGLTSQPECPWLIVQGDQDELVEIEETIAWFNELLPGPELAVVPEAEHFFHGKLVDLRELVTNFVQEKAGENPGS
jgi:alpha/beta superfamily hydrolase